MSAWDGGLYAVGGMYPSGYLDGRISRYDSDSRTWTLQIGVMPTPVVHAGRFQVGHYLYIAGGWLVLGNTSTAETYRYDMATNTWQRGPDLDSPRDYTSLVATGSRLYALGGAYELSEFYDEVYFQELSTWPNVEWTEFADPLPVAYGGMSTAWDLPFSN